MALTADLLYGLITGVRQVICLFESAVNICYLPSNGVAYMNKRIVLPACVTALILLILSFQPAFAHETITVGDYQIEIGWFTEPPIAGQMNAVVVNVSKGEGKPVEVVSNLVVGVAYGDQSKMLMLQPLGEDTPGQFVAPILPSIPGQYTIQLSGKLGDKDVSAAVEPEVVQTPDVVQFPLVEASTQNAGFGLTDWLALLGIVLGLIGIGVGVMALRKSR
jgi:hypothetical protein